MLANMALVQTCYEIALSEKPDAAGVVSLAFKIAPDGSVKCSSISSSSLRNAKVESCMLEKLQAVRFPAADKPTNVVFPFAFRSSQQR
jgi:hypothetical protein